MNYLKKLAAYIENLENVVRIYCFYQTMSKILKTFSPNLLISFPL